MFYVISHLNITSFPLVSVVVVVVAVIVVEWIIDIVVVVDDDAVCLLWYFFDRFVTTKIHKHLSKAI